MISLFNYSCLRPIDVFLTRLTDFFYREFFYFTSLTEKCSKIIRLHSGKLSTVAKFKLDYLELCVTDVKMLENDNLNKFALFPNSEFSVFE